MRTHELIPHIAAATCLVLATTVVVCAQAPVEKTPQPAPSSGVNITSYAAHPAHRDARYSTVKSLPATESYAAWKASAGSMFMERVEKFSQPKGTEILEVLLMFSNNRNVDLPLEIKSIILEAGNNQIDYWELVPGRVYPDYDYMARRLGLSQERPDGELFVTAKFGGTLSTTLKPREKAWLALMFFIPEKTRKANLIAEVPEKRVIDLSPK